MANVNHLVVRSGLVVGALALGVAGCEAGIQTQPAYVQTQPAYVQTQPAYGSTNIQPAAPAYTDDDVAYVDNPPVADVTTYPSAYYGGTTAYLVSDHWYYRSARGWAMYRREPPELLRQRGLVRHDRRGAPEPRARDGRR